jgi:hypothetical protein
MFPTAPAADSYSGKIPGPIRANRAPPHASPVHPGKKRTVSAKAFAIAALAIASVAGREGEDGTGAMWIAPELAALTSPRSGTACHLPARGRSVALSFELLKMDPDSAPYLAEFTTPQVDFDWNPATGELHYRAASGSRVFSDLALASDGGSPRPSCESH